MPLSYGKPAAKNAILPLLKTINFSAPEEYLDFLQKKNGLVVKSPDYCNLPYPGVDQGEVAFSALFGINTCNKYYDLKYNNDEFLEELDFLSDALLIGDDPGGNYFVLMNGAGREGVYYWDRTHLHAEDDIQQFDIAEQQEGGNLYKVAADFTTFYQMVLQNACTQGEICFDDL
ncbi:SMI1/KNR4 family protein [Kosakonia cowanii]|uniref:SMI1/KNR4 family protein n=1 Tax=Kosakonia cowanii TaxID=208223 RepID=UPI0039B7332A